ncbi:hypothetical protein [Burkholderia territorii]|uniref:hypothetical protein n=1 Tax=Burkholderia territorii TaxID=1503055 RepID=UPI000AFFAA6A|nr:hypothetical protein [Burkholderia territorii]
MINLTQGFDREAFDAAHPEAHVDGSYNQLLLCALHRRSKGHGRHEESDPVSSVPAFLLPGFVYSVQAADRRLRFLAARASEGKRQEQSRVREWIKVYGSDMIGLVVKAGGSDRLT